MIRALASRLAGAMGLSLHLPVGYAATARLSFSTASQAASAGSNQPTAIPEAPAAGTTAAAEPSPSTSGRDSQPQQERADPATASAAPATKRLYAANLSWAVREADLKDLFGQFGKVHDAHVARDNTKGPDYSKGYGFVTLDAQAADNAVELLNQTNFKGRILKLNVATSQSGRGPQPDRQRDGPQDRPYQRRDYDRRPIQRRENAEEWGDDRPRGRYHNDRRDNR